MTYPTYTIMSDKLSICRNEGTYYAGTVFVAKTEEEAIAVKQALLTASRLGYECAQGDIRDALGIKEEA